MIGYDTGRLDEIWFIRKNSLHGRALPAAGGRNAVDRSRHRHAPDLSGTPDRDRSRRDHRARAAGQGAATSSRPARARPLQAVKTRAHRRARARGGVRLRSPRARDARTAPRASSRASVDRHERARAPRRHVRVARAHAAVERRPLARSRGAGGARRAERRRQDHVLRALLGLVPSRRAASASAVARRPRCHRESELALAWLPRCRSRTKRSPRSRSCSRRVFASRRRARRAQSRRSGARAHRARSSSPTRLSRAFPGVNASASPSPRCSLKSARLLLDEPANHLDPAQQAAIYALLGELVRGGAGVLCVTHDVNLLRYTRCPARVVGLAEGERRFELPFDARELAERARRAVRRADGGGDARRRARDRAGRRARASARGDAPTAKRAISKLRVALICSVRAFARDRGAHRAEPHGTAGRSCCSSCACRA